MSLNLGLFDIFRTDGLIIRYTFLVGKTKTMLSPSKCIMSGGTWVKSVRLIIGVLKTS